MTIQEWLTKTETELASAGIETARLDALVLLADELQKDKSWLLAYSEHVLQRSEIDKLNTKVIQRLNHTPLAYIRGHAEFYGRDFAVSTHVLIPRPESEDILDILKQIVSPDLTATIVDIGTGSGALAVTASIELPHTKVVATDIDPACLAVAEQNAKTLGAKVTFLAGNLLQPIAEQTLDNPVILLCNLPYVPTNYEVNEAATHEPELALFGGVDGLDCFRDLFTALDTAAFKPTYILTESLESQHEALRSLAANYGYRLEKRVGLVQSFKYKLDSSAFEN